MAESTIDFLTVAKNQIAAGKTAEAQQTLSDHAAEIEQTPSVKKYAVAITLFGAGALNDTAIKFFREAISIKEAAGTDAAIKMANHAREYLVCLLDERNADGDTAEIDTLLKALDTDLDSVKTLYADNRPNEAASKTASPKEATPETTEPEVAIIEEIDEGDVPASDSDVKLPTPSGDDETIPLSLDDDDILSDDNEIGLEDSKAGSAAGSSIIAANDASGEFDTASDLIAAASALRLQGKLGEGFIMLKAKLGDHNKNPNFILELSRNMMGVVKDRSGHNALIKTISSAHRQMPENDPRQADVYGLMARINRRFKDFPKAVEYAEKAIALKPSSEDAHNVLINLTAGEEQAKWQQHKIDNPPSIDDELDLGDLGLLDDDDDPVDALAAAADEMHADPNG